MGLGRGKMTAMFPVLGAFSFGTQFVSHHARVRVCVRVGCVTDYLDARRELLVSGASAAWSVYAAHSRYSRSLGRVN